MITFLDANGVPLPAGIAVTITPGPITGTTDATGSIPATLRSDTLYSASFAGPGAPTQTPSFYGNTAGAALSPGAGTLLQIDTGGGTIVTLAAYVATATGPTSFRRPTRVAIDRRVRGVRDVTGEPALVVTPVVAGVPARLDSAAVTGSAGGAFSATIEGKLYTQTHLLIVDGLQRRQFAPAGPGALVPYLGVPYLVAPNGRGAFVDVRTGDRVTDLGGVTYLVIGVDRYDDIYPNLQARAVQGEASGW